MHLWSWCNRRTSYQTVWETRPSAETPSDVHWRRFYFQLTCVHSALELSGRCALQIYLLTYLVEIWWWHWWWCWWWWTRSTTTTTATRKVQIKVASLKWCLGDKLVSVLVHRICCICGCIRCVINLIIGSQSQHVYCWYCCVVGQRSSILAILWKGINVCFFSSWHDVLTFYTKRRKCIALLPSGIGRKLSRDRSTSDHHEWCDLLA